MASPTGDRLLLSDGRRGGRGTAGAIPRLPPLSVKTSSRYGGRSLLQYRDSQRRQALVSNIVESRAAQNLMSTAQLNRHRPPSPKAPALPEETMSKDRETRLNYEALRQCVARAPITPMPEEQWRQILTQIDPKLVSKPFSPSLISSVRSEVRSRYEETIRKANSKPQTKL
jgi:hypothetical protein